MKTFIAKLTFTLIPLFTLAMLVTFSTKIAGRFGQYQSAAISRQQPGPEMIGTSLDALMINLYLASGR